MISLFPVGVDPVATLCRSWSGPPSTLKNVYVLRAAETLMSYQIIPCILKFKKRVKSFFLIFRVNTNVIILLHRCECRSWFWWWEIGK